MQPHDLNTLEPVKTVAPFFFLPGSAVLTLHWIQIQGEN